MFRDFSIPRNEPLTPFFLKWYKTIEDDEDPLFKAGRKRKGDHQSLTRQQAYRIIRSLGEAESSP
jgi:hypothetical protein